MPVRFLAAAGTAADCRHVLQLIEGIEAGCLLADRAYDADEIVGHAFAHGMEPVIPPKRNRKEKREYDAHLYKSRHRVENAFREIKKRRGLAACYAKTVASFEAAVLARFIHLWLTVLA